MCDNVDGKCREAYRIAMGTRVIMKRIYNICKVEKSERASARSGFTLLEIMMVVMVMGLLTGYAVTSARARFPRMRVDQVSSRLAFKLQLARSEAIAENEIVYVNLDEAKLTFRSWKASELGDGDLLKEIPHAQLGDPALVGISSDWNSGAFNAYGQFITTPGQREMVTVTTRIFSREGNADIDLILRGSGAITKR